MIRFNRGTLVRFLLACSLSLACLPAHASTSLEVSTRCDVKELNDYYAQPIRDARGRPIQDLGQSINNILDKLRYNIIQELQKRPRLTYWSFKPGSPRDSRPGAQQKRNSPLGLEFQVFSPQRNVLSLRMTYRSPAVERSWDADWMDPGQLKTDGYPRFEEAAGKIYDVILGKIFNPHEEDLRSLLEQSAPLAVGGQWDDDPHSLRIVLPLPWESYKSLRLSQFRLDCTWTQDTKEAGVVLITRGDGQSGMFKEKDSKGKERQYEALAASPRAWRYSGEEREQAIEALPNVRQLRPRVAYLYKEEKPASMQIEVFEGEKP